MKPIYWVLLLAGLGGAGYAGYWAWKRMRQIDLVLPEGPEDVPGIEGGAVSRARRGAAGAAELVASRRPRRRNLEVCSVRSTTPGLDCFKMDTFRTVIWILAGFTVIAASIYGMSTTAKLREKLEQPGGITLF